MDKTKEIKKETKYLYDNIGKLSWKKLYSLVHSLDAKIRHQAKPNIMIINNKKSHEKKKMMQLLKVNNQITKHK